MSIKTLKMKDYENKDFYNMIILLDTLEYQNLIKIKTLIKKYLLFMQILNV